MMSSSVVKDNAVKFILALLVLCLGAAVEEMLPKFLNVGIPILLSVLPVVALRPPVILAILFSLMAGTVEDSLGSLPLLTSSSFFMLWVILIRRMRIPLLSAVFAFPFYQVWLCIWVTGLNGSVFSRFLMALPLGALTMGVVFVVLQRVFKWVGADEAD